MGNLPLQGNCFSIIKMLLSLFLPLQYSTKALLNSLRKASIPTHLTRDHLHHWLVQATCMIKTNLSKNQKLKRGHYNQCHRNEKDYNRYYKQLYTNKLNTLPEIGKFLRIHNLCRLNQEKLENLSRSLMSKRVESVIKNI